MALDPRISLGAQGVNIQPPNLLASLLASAQLRESDTQQQLYERRLMALARQEQAAQRVETELQRQLGSRETPRPGMLAQTIQGAPPQTDADAGPITQTALDVSQPFPAPTPPPTPPGAAMPTATRPVPLPGMQGLRQLDTGALLAAGGTEALPVITAVRQAQQQELAGQTVQLKQFEAGVDFMTQALALVHDQSSLDAMRAHVGQLAPPMAQMLPQTYDKATMTALLQRMQAAKFKAQQMQTGLTLQYGRDASGNLVPLQATNQGQIVRSQMPEGVQILPPVMQVDTGLGTQLRSQRGGDLLAPEISKNVGPTATERATGQKLGEEAGELPQKVREAGETLRQLEQKQALAQQDIDKALGLLQTSRLPVAGVAGSAISGVYQPGKDLDVLLTSIRGRLGLEELQQLKASGTTLGQVTAPEHTYLQGTYGSLAQEQNPKQLADMLTRLKSELATNQQRRREAYARDTQRLATGRSGTVEPPQRPATVTQERRGQSQHGKSTQERIIIPKAQADELLRSLPPGITREQAIEQWNSQGIYLEP